MASPAPFPGHRGETSSVWFASTKCLLDINGTQSQCNAPGLVVRKCDCFSRSFHPQQIYQGKVFKHSSHILHLLKAKLDCDAALLINIPELPPTQSQVAQKQVRRRIWSWMTEKSQNCQNRRLMCKDKWRTNQPSSIVPMHYSGNRT